MRKELLIIGLVWPEPNATAAGSRMQQLIHFFISQNYNITFSCATNEIENSINFNTLGIQKKSIKLNHSSFDEFVKKLNPSLVLFDRFLTEEQFGWRVAEQVPNALRILDTEDLHSLRAARHDAFKSGIDFSLNHWLQHDTTKREIASIYRCDLSLIISTYEMEILVDEIKINPNLLLHLPFQLDMINAETKKKWLSFEDRHNFICIGSGMHAPNVDAFLWLKNEIWQLIRKELPDAKLNIFGSYLPQQITELHNPSEGFYVKGRADEAKKVIETARISLAPLRFGAGIKGKLVESMQCGTPSVTTTIGAEGMHQNLPWNGAIANNAETFAKAAIALYQTKKDWLVAQNNGVTIISQLYDKEILNPKLNSKIEELKTDLKTHREQNFIGAMLQQHTMASTKYMSRWIAEKNKE